MEISSDLNGVNKIMIRCELFNFAAHAIDGGYSVDEAPMLISIIGITNTVARVICGAVVDHAKVSPEFYKYKKKVNVTVAGQRSP